LPLSYSHLNLIFVGKGKAPYGPPLKGSSGPFRLPDPNLAKFLTLGVCVLFSISLPRLLAKRVSLKLKTRTEQLLCYVQSDIRSAVKVIVHLDGAMTLKIIASTRTTFSRLTHIIVALTLTSLGKFQNTHVLLIVILLIVILRNAILLAVILVSLVILLISNLVIVILLLVYLLSFILKISIDCHSSRFYSAKCHSDECHVKCEFTNLYSAY
jgi:hypothetical protein